jgi:hypothetical protein
VHSDGGGGNSLGLGRRRSLEDFWRIGDKEERR